MQGIPVTEGTIKHPDGASAASTLLLSKSSFIAAYDCPVRLCHKRDDMRSTKKDDEFLRLLAEGGMQFECLVRAAFPGAELERDYADP
ncbi:MAG: hypothetical protein QF471_01500, partial [Phycisphaerales bacterium]|nr:hypothetical protein [Phycisphaerales bacterium]